jgi:ABC-type uncharacterized transport system permease subunit
MASLRKFAVLLRVSWSDALAYRAEILIWVLTGVLPLVMLAVWRTLAGEEGVGGFTGAEFVTYYVGALTIRQLTGVWIIWDMEREIRLGELSPHLLRPYHPLARYLALALASGYLVPLELLPAPVTQLLLLLPFRAMLSFPVELLLGRLGPAQIAAGLGLQLFWAVALLLLMRLMWRRGLRRYSAVGA